MELNKIYLGDNIETLKSFPDASIDCCITSPPYYGLRDYGTATWIGGDPGCDHVANPAATKTQGNAEFNKNRPSREATKTLGYYRDVCPKCGAIREDKQVGLENTPEEYIDRLVNIFREVKRVLKDEGTLWVNIGDSYNSIHTGDNVSDKQRGNRGSLDIITSNDSNKKVRSEALKSKDLIGIPWMLAFALRDDGWYLRQDIIWQKGCPMPESVKDRCTKSHEYIFLLSKSAKYYFDYKAIQEDAVTEPHCADNKMHQDKIFGSNDRGGHSQWEENMNTIWESDGKRNKRDVWSVNPSRYKAAHFATYPEELVIPMVLAGCPKGGVVLDPFMGSGTTAVVAKNNCRNYVGCELNAKYIEIAEERISHQQMRLF